MCVDIFQGHTSNKGLDIFPECLPILNLCLEFIILEFMTPIVLSWFNVIAMDYGSFLQKTHFKKIASCMPMTW